MKRILILYPHFPPSNLAGVHRPRLFAQHLPSFGWEPVILTVHEKYYEEALDWNLHRLIPENLRIEKVNAFPLTRPRIVGDIGLRAFFQLYKRAKELVKNEHFDFLYIPIPSFYCALLGRMLHAATGIQYGIDYIDPWVHEFPGSNKIFSRPWFSKQLAKLLEPIAVKKASLIMGVAEGYYKAVLDRNPHLKRQAVYGAMPYGGEEKDHELLKELDLKPYLFEKKAAKVQLVYAGAMLPKAFLPLEAIFNSIKANSTIFQDVEFHFIGTGKTTGDEQGHNIKPIAEKYGIWHTHIYEYPKRIPYLDVLVHLQHADGIFILGSTEPHYTPSKSYQGVLSGKPILAVLHKESTAVEVLQKSQAAVILAFGSESCTTIIARDLPEIMLKYLKFIQQFDLRNINKTSFNVYSAIEVTSDLAKLLNRLTENSVNRIETSQKDNI